MIDVVDFIGTSFHEVQKPHGPSLMFATLGNAFAIGTSAVYFGCVVMSHDGFYVVSNKPPMNLHTLIAGKVGSDNTDVELFPLKLNQLPQDVLNHSTWPLADNNGRVLFLPRTDVQSVRCTILSKQVIIVTDRHRVKIINPDGSRRSILKMLRKMQWR